MGNEKENHRGTWGSKIQFLLACVGFAVGVGNIWRFPYLCYVSGGGAFLIPYFTMLAFLAIPLLYLEMAVGQLVRLGPVHALAKLCPLCKGVGAAMVTTSFIIASQYNMVIAWALHYLFHSFSNPLPWKNCDNDWNNERCSTILNTNNTNTTLIANSTTGMILKTQSPSLQYFTNFVLQVSSGIDDVGTLIPQTVGFLFLSTLIVFCCVWKGVKSVGKAVYFTATFPYIVLFILLVRSVTLPGASEGIYYYLSPNWSKLLDPKIWILAGTQNFNSLGIAYGSIMAFSSYNTKTNNILHDTLTVGIINSGTSFLAGFVVFSSLGGLAHTLGIKVEDAVSAGPELVFVAIPSLFNHLPLPSIWSVIFFLMLVTLGVGSQFGNLEVVSTTIMDFLRNKVSSKRLKITAEATVCFACFLLGLPHCTQAGMYFFTLVDNYAAVISIMTVAYFEVMTVWFFGGNRLAREISFLSGHRPLYYMPFCWNFVTPIIMTTMTFFSMYQFSPVGYGGYKLPIWANVLGAFITLCSIIWIPVGMVHQLIFSKGSIIQRFVRSFTPGFVPERQRKSNHSEEYKRESVSKGIPLLESANSEGMRDGRTVSEVDSSGVEETKIATC